MPLGHLVVVEEDRVDAGGDVIVGDSGTKARTVISCGSAPWVDMTDTAGTLVHRASDLDLANRQGHTRITAFVIGGDAKVVALAADQALRDRRGSIHVEIAGPVEQIVIDFDDCGRASRRPRADDIYFETIVGDVRSNDSISGGAGSDMIYGGLGGNNLNDGTGEGTDDVEVSSDTDAGNDMVQIDASNPKRVWTWSDTLQVAGGSAGDMAIVFDGLHFDPLNGCAGRRRQPDTAKCSGISHG